MLHIVPRDARIADVVPNILRAASAYGVLAYDVESSGVPMRLPNAKLRTVQFGTDTEAWFFDASNPVHRGIIEPILRDAKHLTAHGAQFDIKWLAHEGLADHDTLWRKTTDTFILSHVFDSNREHHDLKTLSASWGDGHSLLAQKELYALGPKPGNKWVFNPTPKTAFSKNGWGQVPLDNEVYQRYACSDVLDGARLCMELLPYLFSEDDRRIVEDEHRIARLMSAATSQGWLVDIDHANAIKAQLEPEVASLKGVLKDIGIENPNANRQIATKLIEEGAKLYKSPKGEWIVDSDALERINSSTSQLILAYKEASKALTTYVGNTLYYAQGDGRIHATIRTLGARTARMSSGEPNLQNYPSTGPYRAMLVADENETLISCDFSSVEPRVMAAVTRDANLLRDYENGIDPYVLLAEHCFPEEWASSDASARKALRKIMKPTLLGRAYMGGVNRLATQTGQPTERVETALEFIDTRYPRIREYSQELLERANQGLPEVTTLSGRRVPLHVSAPYTGGNSEIQSFARDLLVYSCFELEDMGLWDTVRAPIHDEMVGSVPEKEAEDYRQAYLKAMHTTVNGVTIEGEADILGRSWHK